MARPKMVHPGVVFAAFTFDPASINANTAAAQTVTVKGLRPGHPVVVWAPSLEANVVICNAYCSALNTLSIRFGNLTGSAIDPASQTMYVVQL